MWTLIGAFFKMTRLAQTQTAFDQKSEGYLFVAYH